MREIMITYWYDQMLLATWGDYDYAQATRFYEWLFCDKGRSS